MLVFLSIVGASFGEIFTVAGNGEQDYTGEGGAAISAGLNQPNSVHVDGSGDIYIADTQNNRVRKVDGRTGTIATIAGNGEQGYSGDGGPGSSASLVLPGDIFVDGSGTVYIADTFNYVIRKVDGSTGIITTVAGDGGYGFSGDDVSALVADLASPFGIHVDGSGNIYIADSNNNRIRKVDVSTGIIATVAGNGQSGYSGDGGAATSASLNNPIKVCLDHLGNIYIADGNNNRIRRVDGGTGIITTMAGNGEEGVSGDGFAGDSGPATSARLFNLGGVSVDESGNVYFVSNNRIRKVDVSTGIITTVAGNGGDAFSGDGGPATRARLSDPRDVFVDGSDNIYIADTFNNRIRKVVPEPLTETTVAGGPSGDTAGMQGSEIQFFSIGITGDGKNSVNGIAFTLADLSEATGLASNDFTELRLYWSVDGILDGDDVQIGRLGQEKIELGGSTTFPATSPHTPPQDMEVFYIVSAVIAADATEGHAFKVGFEEGGVGTSGVGLGSGVAADDANRISISAIPDPTTTITASPTTNSPVVDGEISEGEYGDAVPIEVDFLNQKDSPGMMLQSDMGPLSKEDLSFKVYATYTNTDLYIVVDVTDDVVKDDSPGEPWNDDNIELFFDGDLVSNDVSLGWGNSSAEGFNILLDVGGEFGDGFHAAGRRPGGRIHEFKISIPDWIDVQDGPGRTPPTPGSTIGFSVFVADDDGQKEWPDVGAWIYKQDLEDKYLEDFWGRLFFSPWASQGGEARFDPPEMALSRGEIDFGNLPEEEGKTETITISNGGNLPLEATLSVEGDEVFGLSTEEVMLEPGSTVVEITFAPSPEGNYDAVLVIESNDPDGGSVSVPITGKRSPAPRIDYSKSEISFGDVFVRAREVEILVFSRTETLVLRNEGGGLLEMAFSLEGDSGFELSTEGVTLVPGDDEEIEITFAPLMAGEYAATLKIESGDPENREVVIPLTGTGIAGEDSRMPPIDPRRSDVWQLAGSVNLGPKGGNIERGRGIVIDGQRNRAFVGGFWGPIPHGIATTSLQLGVVTGLIDQDAFVSGIFSGDGRSLAIDKRRNELYVTSSQGVFLQVVDLDNLSVKNQIDLGGDHKVPGVNLGHIMVVDDENERLYGIVRQQARNDAYSVYFSANMWAVDLQSGETIADIPLRAISDVALGQQVLYAADVDGRTIQVVGLQDFQISETLPSPLGLVPVALALDSEQPFLYVYVVDTDEKYRFRDDLRPGWLTRMNLTTGEVDGQIRVGGSYGALMELDESSRTLWTDLSGGLEVDLEDFKVIRRGFFPELIFSQYTGLAIDSINREILLVAGLDNFLLRVNMDDGRTKSRIQLGALPKDMAVSEVHNQVYISRGQQGGFSVFDATGHLLNTIEEGNAGDIVVDDISDRLFIASNRGAEERDEIYVYELSTLRLLNVTFTAKAFNRNIELKLDHERGVAWINVNPGLVKLDLLTGRILEQTDTYGVEGGGAWMMELSPDGSKAYFAGLGEVEDNKKVFVFDLTTKKVVKSIETPVNRTILHAVDKVRNRLYVSGQSGSPDEGRVLIVIDTERDEIIEVKELEHRLVSANGMRAAFFDFEEGLIYHPPARRPPPDHIVIAGWITDLETGATQKYGEFSTIDNIIAHNRITNTIYAASVADGLSITLGPAGTEVGSPPAPAELEVVPRDEGAFLTWSAVDDPILAGYHVYRRDRANAAFNRITQSPLTDTTFADIELINEQAYSYYLTSIGQGALESIVGSDTVSVTPVGGANFRLLVLSQSLSVAQGDSASIALGLEALEGFGEEVTLSAQMPDGIEVAFTPAQVVPSWVVAMRVRVSTEAPLGRFEIGISGEGGGKEQTVQLPIEVTRKAQEGSILTLGLDQEEVPLDIPLLVSGRLFPGSPGNPIQLEFRAERADTLITRTADTDAEGGYRVEFRLPFSDGWSVTASWAGNDDFEGATSRTVAFAVTSGKTRITATSDLADDADLGFVATLKGRIYPSPGAVAVNITVRRPDKTEEVIEGILSSPEGFYGHDLSMNQKGIWEVWASWQGNDRLLGAASPVITIPVQADVGRVILLAGGQDSNRDVFWPTSNYLGNLAYTTFQRRRLAKEKIFYLNDRQEQDVDRDGFMADVDAGATMSAWSDAWTWARERVQSDSPLYVYLVGKGQPAGLEIGDGEMLTATQLLQDLDGLEEATGVQATLIVDAAHAGNFIRDLSDQGRHVIASTGPGLAFYQAEGYLSFSQYFLTDLFQGKSVQEAFLHTDKILRNLPGAFRQQDPGLEAQGNLIPNQPGDYLQTLDAIIGAPFELGDLSP
ncbi:MAG: choice-of-anchor D domain-containing protein, partial [Gemmatimonadetes bacterium]|nr:choice-of-anchor D domain-containing protein [Gemmatimonadota bacterium]